MTVTGLLVDGLWAALFAGAFGILLTTPPGDVLPCVLAGFIGRVVVGGAGWLGATASWSTVLATVAGGVVASLQRRGSKQAPVAIVCGVIPLGAAVDVFRTIVGLLRLPAVEGAGLEASAVELVVDGARAFTTTLAIAVGIASGMVLLRVGQLRRRRVSARPPAPPRRQA